VRRNTQQFEIHTLTQHVSFLHYKTK